MKDWYYLQQRTEDPLGILRLNQQKNEFFEDSGNEIIEIDTDKILFPFLPSIFYNLHCCYENAKLTTVPENTRSKIACFLQLIAQ